MKVLAFATTSLVQQPLCILPLCLLFKQLTYRQVPLGYEVLLSVSDKQGKISYEVL